MADESQLEILLKHGVAAWNEWRRKEAVHILVDLSRAVLSGADLSQASLSGVSLRGADLRGANLSEASLSGASLSGASLRGADLRRANLSGADLGGADLSEGRLSGAGLRRANLRGANLSEADLRGADLSEARLGGIQFGQPGLRLGETNLSGADLSGADLGGTNLRGVNLSRAVLSGADLSRADFSWANLSGANLSKAALYAANLKGAVLGECNFELASFHETDLSNVDLSRCKGLEFISHRGPSPIDIRTLQHSGPLPLVFLRGVGLPNTLIEYLPSLLNQSIQLYSCFISYSAKNEDFVRRLHADLQDNGVRCWFAPEDMKIGAKILEALDQAIRLRDKILLVLSEASIASYWVEDEVTRGFAEERQRGMTVLFPVRIDDAVFATTEVWARKLCDNRNIGDFRRWKEHDAYRKALARLLRDLRVEPA